MHSRFYLSLLLISGLVLLMFIGLDAYREMTSEWKTYQSDYKDFLIKNAEDEDSRKRAQKIEIGIRQNYLSSLNKADRCMSCHIGVENPLMAKEELPFKQHSGNYLENHPVDKFGCTICHYGQGRATNRKEAHGEGRDTHWDFPIIPPKYIQSTCAICHDYQMLEKEGADLVVKGEKLFREKGCKGCHKLNGVGGDLGKALDGIGSKPLHYFPMKHVVGDLTAYNWHKQHFEDPRQLVLESEMRVFLTKEEADLLTAFIFTMREEEIPSKYRLIKHIRTLKVDGESLYKMYCIACHETGKNSVYDETLKRTIPAIMNPAFLKSINNETLKKMIEEGRSGTHMTAWKTTAAGLSDGEINKIIEYMTRERPDGKPEPFKWTKFEGNTKRGEDLYKVRCAFCHGEKGKGGKDKLGINLRNPVVQKLVKPEFLAMTVRDGRKGTPMPPFGGENGLGLTDQDIADVVTYVRALGKKK